MINSTLGGLIKDYRLQKGISQLDIAFALGWKEPSRLSRIEQGRTERPSRDVLDKIIQALDLAEEEKNMLLLTSGYLPTEAEIERIRQETKPVLNTWKYPASLLDFSWRIISQNEHNARLYQIPPETVKMIEKKHIRILDVIFNIPVQKNESPLSSEGPFTRQWKEFLSVALLNFKYEQRHRTKEKWYIEHVKNLMDNALFRELWVETDSRQRLEGVIGKSGTKSMLHPQDPSRLLNFYMFIVPVLKDPRFEIELLVPSDLQTFQFYQTTGIPLL